MADKTSHIFSRLEGNVVALIDPLMDPDLTLLTLDKGTWGGFEGFKAIITSVGVSKHSNFQFLHTLGGGVYVYVFGGRIGELVISGIAFDYPCTGGDKTGAEHVLTYFDEQNLVQRAEPITVTLGHSYAMQAYLTNASVRTTSPVDGLYEFTLTMAVPPPSNQTCLRYSSSSTVAATQSVPPTVSVTPPGAIQIEPLPLPGLVQIAPSPPTPGSIQMDGDYSNDAFAPQPGFQSIQLAPLAGLQQDIPPLVIQMQ